MGRRPVQALAVVGNESRDVSKLPTVRPFSDGRVRAAFAKGTGGLCRCSAVDPMAIRPLRPSRPGRRFTGAISAFSRGFV